MNHSFRYYNVVLFECTQFLLRCGVTRIVASLFFLTHSNTRCGENEEEQSTPHLEMEGFLLNCRDQKNLGVEGSLVVSLSCFESNGDAEQGGKSLPVAETAVVEFG